jgi:hypothetical protein
MMLVMFGWFQQKAQKKKVILAAYHHRPELLKEQFEPSVGQHRRLTMSIQNKSAIAFDAISASIKRFTITQKSTSDKWPEVGATASETKTVKRHSYLKRKIRRLAHPVMRVSTFSRWLTSAVGRQDVRDDVSQGSYGDAPDRSAATLNGSESLPRHVSDEQASLVTNCSVVKEIIPPLPAVLPRLTHHNDLLGLKKKALSRPKLMIATRTARVKDSCRAVSKSSTVSAVSETKHPDRDDECPVRPLPANAGLFRWNVHRVEMDFRPRKDSQLRVDEGDEVVLTRLFDDGWVRLRP